MGKSLVLAVQIIGDARSAIKATEDTSTAFQKLAAPAAFAGGAAGAALTAGFFSAVSFESGLTKIQGQLALTEEESARVGVSAAELFANGFGTGADQINEAISSVVGNISGMREATDTELTAVSGSVLNLANTFDQDLGSITTAVGQMIRTGMAPDAEAALDIITVGLQSSSRAGDDLLDTFTEYPALFERLGLDGQTATGLISQGMEAGARSTDLVADALKEFQVRAIDSSETSKTAFEALGLNAADMTAQIASGGENATAGLDLVLDRLRNMTDPVAQNAAAVGLFGTQAEDLGGALFALDPSSAVDALGSVTGAAQKLSETMAGDPQTTITNFQRSLTTGFQEVAAEAIPIIQPILEKLTEFAPILAPLAVAIAGVSGAVLVINGAMKAYAAIQVLQTAAQWASNAAWLASPITWIVLAVVAAIALLVGAAILIVQNWDKIKAAGVAAWEAIISGVRTAIDWLGSRISGAINGVKSYFSDLGNSAVRVFDNIVNAVRKVINWVANLARNAIPGWARDLLGMGRASRAMIVTPEFAGAPETMYSARMAFAPATVEPVSPMTATASTAAPAMFSDFAALSVRTPAIGSAPVPPQSNEISDNRTYNFSFPNYIGDESDLSEIIEKAIKRTTADRGLIQA